jgi:hypothetical protein
MKQIFLSLSVLALAAAPLAAHAAPCRDAKGRFTSCHSATAKPAGPKPTDRHPMAKATPAPHATLAAHAAPSPRPSASAAAKHCKIGNRFASCSAPGAKPV